MTKFFEKVGRIFFGMVLAIFLLGINSVSAADAKIDAMKAFEEAMTKSAKVNTGIFREDILFITPTMQNELEFMVKTDKGNDFKAAGDFTSWANNESGDMSELSIPFYISHENNTLQIHFEFADKWYKFQTTSAVVNSPERDEIQDFDVKEVILLQETDKRRTMLVKLDGNKIADDLKADAAKESADKKSEGDEFSGKFLQYIDSGLRNSEVWYTITFNKQNWQVIAISVNLSGLVQAVAREALNDPDQKLTDSGRELLETVAFLSETKAYTTYLKSDAAKKLELPEEAKQAESLEDLFSGGKIFQD